MTTGARDLQLVICGLGGQGTVFLTRLLAEAALLEGRAVLTAETHGMAQRGGAVESHLKLGEFSGSTVRRGCADAAVVLDGSRLEVGRAYLRPRGTCFVNGSPTAPDAYACDASGIAAERRCERGGNLVLLGYAAATAPSLFPGRAALLEALDRLSPPPAREANRRAFAAGEEAA